MNRETEAVEKWKESELQGTGTVKLGTSDRSSGSHHSGAPDWGCDFHFLYTKSIIIFKKCSSLLFNKHRCRTYTELRANFSKIFWAKFGGKIRGADGRRHAYEVHVPYKDASTGAQSAKAPAPAALNAKTHG